MPSKVFTNPYVMLTTSSQALHSQLTSITLNEVFDEHDDTRFGMTSHSRIPGLSSWSLEGEAVSEYLSTEAVPLDKVLEGLKGGGAFEVEVRPENAARSSDNPGYVGNVRMFERTPLGGAVGELLKTPIRFLSAGSLSRLTSSS